VEAGELVAEEEESELELESPGMGTIEIAWALT
jgi:hypothetical protein